MEHDGEAYWTGAAGPPDRAPRRRRPSWLLIGGLALAFALALGVGALLGSSLLGTAQAAGGTANGASTSQQIAYSGPSGAFAPQDGFASAPSGPSGQGQCEAYTVSSVSGGTIVAKAADGSTVTIHTTSSTTYTRNGQSASASAVTAGARIHVMGTRNSDGSITATSIDVG
jgi:hypothetical protein